jgi:hypothetical protein
MVLSMGQRREDLGEFRLSDDMAFEVGYTIMFLGGVVL